MISVVIAYYNRKPQLEVALRTIDCENIIIVDDASDEKLVGDGVINISKEEKYWLSDGTIPYNRGIARALEIGSDIIILQNAECYHVGDVIKYALENTTDDNYISFPCFSLSKDADLIDAMKENNRAVLHNGDNGWYNHKEYRPNGYMFCASITANTLRKMNGFDERFSHGVAMADADFVRRLGVMGIKIEIPDAPFVVHQWHYDDIDPYSIDGMYKRNQDLHKELSEGNNYYAKHLLTKDF